MLRPKRDNMESLEERRLTRAEELLRDKIVRGMIKTNRGGFIRRYGRNAEKVMHSAAERLSQTSNNNKMNNLRVNEFIQDALKNPKHSDIKEYEEMPGEYDGDDGAEELDTDFIRNVVDKNQNNTKVEVPPYDIENDPYGVRAVVDKMIQNYKNNQKVDEAYDSDHDPKEYFKKLFREEAKKYYMELLKKGEIDKLPEHPTQEFIIQMRKHLQDKENIDENVYGNVNMSLSDIEEMGYEAGEEAFENVKGLFKNAPDHKAYRDGVFKGWIDNTHSYGLNEKLDVDNLDEEITLSERLAKQLKNK